jgi:hypothetical protein
VLLKRHQVLPRLRLQVELGDDVADDVEVIVGPDTDAKV